MKEATIFISDDVIEALEAYRHDTDEQVELPTVAATVLRTYLQERGYLPAVRPLHITPAPEGSGKSDVSTAHDRELASH